MEWGAEGGWNGESLWRLFWGDESALKAVVAMVIQLRERARAHELHALDG